MAGKSRIICGVATGLVVTLLTISLLSYVLLDYQILKIWYLGLGTIYRQVYWPREFFSETTKATGNYYALAGIGIAMFLAYLPRPTTLPARPKQRISTEEGRGDWPVIAVLTVTLGAAYYFGHTQIRPAYDEVFSVMEVAAIHPFQAWSYYMLPNNHVLYNLLSGMTHRLFGSWTNDPVLTGRLLSALAGLCTAQLLLFHSRKVAGVGRWVRGVLVLLLMLIFPVWGFAIQARGYGLLLLFSWLACFAVQRLVERNDQSGLRTFVISSVAGFATVPIFLYVYVGLSAWWAIVTLRGGQRLSAFLWAQFLVGGLTYLFYLPILLFSGLGALTGNRYVAARNEDVINFGMNFLTTLKNYGLHALEGLGVSGWAWASVLFLLPALLLYALSGRERTRNYAGSYLSVVTVTTLIVIGMRAIPFYRTMLFQQQFGVLLLLVGLVVGVVRMGERLRLPQISVDMLIAVLTVSLLLYSAPASPPLFREKLYFYSVNATYYKLSALTEKIPRNATVTFGDEAFYPRYLRNQGVAAADGNGEEYWLIGEQEDLPPPDGPWELIDEAAGLKVYRLR